MKSIHVLVATSLPMLAAGAFLFWDSPPLTGPAPAIPSRAGVAQLDRPREPASPKKPKARTVAEMEQGIREASKSGDLDAFISAFTELAQTNPRKAAELFGTMHDRREDALRCLVRTWAARDPADALHWAGNRENPDERETALNALCYVVAEFDPGYAVEIAVSSGLGDNERLLPDLAQQWAMSDFDAAEEWAQRQPPGENRNLIHARLATELARTQPEQAVELLRREIPPGPIQNEGAISVLHQWAIRNPADASVWVATFRSGELRDRAAQELAGITAFQNMSGPDETPTP